MSLTAPPVSFAGTIKRIGGAIRNNVADRSAGQPLQNVI